MKKEKGSKELIEEHLTVVRRLIMDTEYHFTNLEFLYHLNEEDKKIVSGFMVLRNYRSILWHLIVLDLNKLLNNNKNDKFNLGRLIKRAKENRYKQFWKHPVEFSLLNAYEEYLIKLEDQISRLNEVRDKHVAHFDNKEVNFSISLPELKVLLSFCKDVYNSINYCLADITTHWYFPEMDMINPVIFNLSNYSKIRNLFYENLTKHKSTIDMNQLSKIIRPQAQVNVDE